MVRNRQLLDPESEKPILEALYLREAVATDQLRRAPEALERITRAFNRLADRDFTGSELLRYMINRRKNRNWIKLGSKAIQFESLRDYLTSAQLEVLKQIYLELDICSDAFLYGPKLMLHIASRFHALAGRKEPGSLLVGVIMAFRKRGLWPTIREEDEDFGDIKKFA